MGRLGKALFLSTIVHGIIMAAAVAALSGAASKPVACIDLTTLHHTDATSSGLGTVATAMLQQERSLPSRPQEQKKTPQVKTGHKKPPMHALPSGTPKRGAPLQPHHAEQKGSLPAAGEIGSDNETGRQSSGGFANDGEGSGIGFGSGAGDTAYTGMYFGYINDLVRKKVTYPLLARRMGWEGTVTVAFVIQKNGSITDVSVLKSSGHEALDDNARTAVKTLSRLPEPPFAVEIHLPVVYKLEE